MKKNLLKNLSENITSIMNNKNISAKELSAKAKIGYSSLMPILNGIRDCGISKLIVLADALECSPNDLLTNTYCFNTNHNGKSLSLLKFRYLAAFISQISVTYCIIYDIDTKKSSHSVLQSDIHCAQDADTLLTNIINFINTTLNEKIKVNNKEIAVFVSAQKYEAIVNREKLYKKGNQTFAKFIIESDAITNHNALLENKNGICVTINNGNVITYSTDYNKNITKLQGYGFPIADIAGNYWLGCEAIKYAINVKEKAATQSLLSDRILALFNNNLTALSECAINNPDLAYHKTSTIVKELIHEEKFARKLVQTSANLLVEKIKTIDMEIKTKLPIVLAGELARTYEEFMPKSRILKLNDKLDNTLLNYGINVLKETLKLD